MERVLRIELEGAEGGSIRLRYLFDDSTPDVVRDVAVSTISALLDRAESDYYALSDDDDAALMRRLGGTLFRFLDTAERRLSGFLERTAGSWDVLVLMLTVGGRLAHLPWELLHDSQRFLAAAPRPVLVVRSVPGTLPPVEPQRRSLRMLFAAYAPDGIGAPLDFEYEEAQIWEATRKQRIDLQVEESGSLAGLQELMRAFPERHFDVVHLTGHATHTSDGPRFVTETATGSRLDASARDLRDAFQYRWPSLIFLSGCRTAESAEVGVVPSLAEQLVTHSSTRVVVGWGRPVADEISTRITAVLYRTLAQGLPPAVALAETYRSMIEQEVAQWHLLRVFAQGDLPGPLVVPAMGAGGDSRPAKSQWRRIGGALPVPERGAFVGRRREVQRLIRVLHPGADGIGVIVHGMGGMGKSTLVGRVLTRLGDAYRPVVFQGFLGERALLDAIAADLELATALDATPQGARLRHRLLSFLDRCPSSLLFVLDDFELNFSPDRAGGQHVRIEGDRAQVQPEAAAVIRDLVEAVAQSDGDHRIVVTSRYLPALDVMSRFEAMPITPLGETDVEKLIIRLRRVKDDVPDGVVARIRALAGQNPRLLEWLFTVARSPVTVDESTLQSRLRDRRQEFLVENIFADTVLSQVSHRAREVLHAAVPFRQHCSAAVLAELMDSDVAEVAGQARDLADLGLLEPDVDAAGEPVYRVPIVLESRLRDEDAAAYREQQARCAAVLARGMGDPVDEPDVRRLDPVLLREVQRLALAADDRELAVCSTVGLGQIEELYYRFDSAIRICTTVLDRYSDYRLLMVLANQEGALGHTRQAEQYLQRARQACPGSATGHRAQILVAEANGYLLLRNPRAALKQLREGERLARAAGSDVALVESLCGIADLLCSVTGPRGLDAAAGLYDEAAAVAGRIDDGGLRLLEVRRSRAVNVAPSVDAAAGIGELEAVADGFRRAGLTLHAALVLANIMGIHLGDGRTAESAALLAQYTAEIRPTGWAFGEVIGAALEVMLAFVEQRHADAVVLLDDALAGVRRLGNTQLEEILIGLQVRVHSTAGRFDMVMEVIGEALTLRSHGGVSVQKIEFLVAAAEASKDAGDHDMALSQAREAVEQARAVGLPVIEARALWVLVNTRIAQQRLLDADVEPALRALVELGQRTLDVPGEWLAQVVLGIQLFSSDRSDEAYAALTAADALGDEVGAPGERGALYVNLARIERERNELPAALRLYLRSARAEAAVGAWADVASALTASASILGSTYALLAGEILHVALAAARLSGPLTESAVLTELAGLSERSGRPVDAETFRSAAAATEVRADPLRIVVGVGLVRIADPEAGGQLLAGVAALRESLAADSDVVLPPVRVVDDLVLGERDYQILVHGDEVVTSTLPTDRAEVVDEMEALLAGGTVTVEPGFAPDRLRWLLDDVPEPEGPVVTAEEVLLRRLRSVATQPPAEPPPVQAESGGPPALDVVDICVELAIVHIADLADPEVRARVRDLAGRAEDAGLAEVAHAAWTILRDAPDGLTFDEELEAHDRVVALHRTAGDRPAESMAIYRKACRLQDCGFPADAIPAFREALNIDTRLGDVGGQATLHSKIAVCLMGVAAADDDPDRASSHKMAAEGHLRRSAAAAHEVGATGFLARRLVDLAYLWGHADEVIDRIPLLAVALDAAHASGETEAQCEVLRCLAFVMRAQGAPDADVATVEAEVLAVERRAEPLRVELSQDLTPVFDDALGGVVLTRWQEVREPHLDDEIPLPGIHFVVTDLQPERTYVLYVWGVPILSRELPARWVRSGDGGPPDGPVTDEPGMSDPVHWLLAADERPRDAVDAGEIVVANLRHAVLAHRAALPAPEPATPLQIRPHEPLALESLLSLDSPRALQPAAADGPPGSDALEA